MNFPKFSVQIATFLYIYIGRLCPPIYLQHITYVYMYTMVYNSIPTRGDSAPTLGFLFITFEVFMEIP